MGTEALLDSLGKPVTTPDVGTQWGLWGSNPPLVLRRFLSSKLCLSDSKGISAGHYRAGHLGMAKQVSAAAAVSNGRQATNPSGGQHEAGQQLSHARCRDK